MKTFLPKVNYKDVDLEPFGGSGVIRVHAMTTEVQLAVTAELQARVEADGYKLSDIESKAKEIDSKYMQPLMVLTLKKCTTLFDEDLKERPLTEDEVLDLPVALASKLYYTVGELNAFPLAQNAGEVSKKEQSKPIEEE